MESQKSEEPKSDERGWVSSISATHIPALDGLRALAVILVLLRHSAHLFVQHTGLELSWQFAGVEWSNVFLNGWIGVDLFFVLSGFLITRPLFRSDKRQPLRIYAIKRIFRIVPAYVSTLVLILLGAFPLYTYYQESLLQQLAIHLLFLQDYLGAHINVVMWSLGVEEKFYFLVPLLFLFFKRARGKWLQFVILCGLVLFSPLIRYVTYLGLGSPHEYADFFYTLRAPFHVNFEPLFFGVLIAWAERHRLQLPMSPMVVWLASCAGLFAILASHNMLANITLYDAVLQPSLIALVMAGLVYAAVYGVSFAILTNRVSRYLAKISYSLYLLHWPLFPVSLAIAVELVGAGTSTIGLFWTLVIVFFSISIAAAAVQFRLIERPFMNLRKQLTK